MYVAFCRTISNGLNNALDLNRALAISISYQWIWMNITSPSNLLILYYYIYYNFKYLYNLRIAFAGHFQCVYSVRTKSICLCIDFSIGFLIVLFIDGPAKKKSTCFNVRIKQNKNDRDDHYECWTHNFCSLRSSSCSKSAYLLLMSSIKSTEFSIVIIFWQQWNNKNTQRKGREKCWIQFMPTTSCHTHRRCAFYVNHRQRHCWVLSIHGNGMCVCVWLWSTREMARHPTYVRTIQIIVCGDRLHNVCRWERMRMRDRTYKYLY